MQEPIRHLRRDSRSSCSRRARLLNGWKISLLAVLLAATVQADARDKNGVQYGSGLIVNVPFPESEVTQVVQDVVQNGIIRGTKEYNKDEYVSGAASAASTRVFPAWTEGGKVFYKVREHALDPRNFKDSSDVGTLAVRYVVQPQPQDSNSTVLRIDAVFVEDFRHTAHQSNGSVEGAEYKDIHDRLDSLASIKDATAQALREKQEQEARMAPALANVVAPVSAKPSAPIVESRRLTPPPSADPPAAALPENLEDRVKELRRQVERIVKEPGAPLKSAPFHTATTLQSLPAKTEVLIVITTPYWLGVETHEGQHGWILRDDLEFVP